MEIKEHRLLLFIELYEEKFGITLTKSEAHEKATLLMQYVLLFLKPLAKIEENDITSMPNVSE
jgi:hypothetical protein